MLFTYLITYQNKKKETIYRIVEFPIYQIGDITPMNWYIVDIQLLYNNRFYSVNEIEDIENNKELNKSLLKKIIEKIKL